MDTGCRVCSASQAARESWLRCRLGRPQKHRTWFARTDEHATWLFTADMSLALSRRGVPVLEVRAYPDYGVLEIGFWVQDKHGNWQRCADCNRMADLHALETESTHSGLSAP